MSCCPATKKGFHMKQIVIITVTLLALVGILFIGWLLYSGFGLLVAGIFLMVEVQLLLVIVTLATQTVSVTQIAAALDVLVNGRL